MSQLTNYIQKELDKGFSKDLVTEKLIQAGYTKDEINDSFKSLKSAEPLLRRKLSDTIHEDTKVLRSKWLFPIIGILVLIVLVYLVFQYVDVTEPIISKTRCETLEGYDKDICYLKAAAEGESSCDKINGTFYKTLCEQKFWETNECDYKIFIGEDKEQCLLQKAIETQDPTYCVKKIHNEIDCLFKLAQDTDNPAMCDNELWCYQQYAVFKQDSTLCELHPIEQERKFCYTYYNETMVQ
ncbi:MAG: hypothetical protein WC254_04020 [Candidatus Woesearchaeota archaeon]|jgi:hypothetical protein